MSLVCVRSAGSRLIVLSSFLLSLLSEQKLYTEL